MTNDELEDTYPHWKDALFGNHNAVANVRCAAHYVFWHSIYGAIAFVGLLVLGMLTVGHTLAPYFGPLGAPIERGLERLRRGVLYVANHRYTELVVMSLLALCIIGAVVTVTVALLWLLYSQFWATILTMASMLVGIVLFLVVGAAIEIGSPYFFDAASNVTNYTASKARQAGERAVETPGVRRIYGECPVSLSMAPNWFDNLFPEDEY